MNITSKIVDRAARVALLTRGEASAPLPRWLRRRLARSSELGRYAAALQAVDHALGEGASAPTEPGSAERRARIMSALRREQAEPRPVGVGGGWMLRAAVVSIAVMLVAGGVISIRGGRAPATSGVEAVDAASIGAPTGELPSGAVGALARSEGGSRDDARGPTATPAPDIAQASRALASLPRRFDEPLRREADLLVRDGRKAARVVLAAWRSVPGVAELGSRSDPVRSPSLAPR